MVPSPTPKRDHGDPQSFGFEARTKVKLVRAEGLEPSRALRPNGFSYPATAFAAPANLAAGFGVWTIPSPCPDLAPGVRWCPSSLYTFPAVSSQAWLGIAMLQGSPTLSSSASPVSRRALKFIRLSPMRLPIPPRPPGFKGSTKQRLTRSDLLSPFPFLVRE
jgi:hypothetical protein